MEDEITTLQTNHTWDIVVFPPDKRVSPFKWVYEFKEHVYGRLEILKSMLVVRGYVQKEGIDRHGTFFPVVKITTTGCLLDVVAKKGWDIS